MEDEKTAILLCGLLTNSDISTIELFTEAMDIFVPSVQSLLIAAPPLLTLHAISYEVASFCNTHWKTNKYMKLNPGT